MERPTRLTPETAQFSTVPELPPASPPTYRLWEPSPMAMETVFSGSIR